jgi:hypothetical protein
MRVTPKFPVSTLVEVDWVDSASRGRWDSLENYRNEVTAKCRSAGYLITKNKRVVILLQTQSVNTMNDALDSITIPRGCITRIRHLK